MQYGQLHDVVFATGGAIEATYEKLMDRWFGDPLSVHIDLPDRTDRGRWLSHPARAATGRRSRNAVLHQPGGIIQPGEFTELHANAFLVGSDEQVVKERAKQELLGGADSVHKDDLLDIDDCLRINLVDGLYVHLENRGIPSPLAVNHGYHVIPKSIMQAYAASRGLT